MIVEFTGSAEGDLERIGDAIARDDPFAAQKFIQSLRRSCLSLEEMPLRYPLVPRRESSGLRRRPFGRYLIFYKVEDDTLWIVRIFHGAMDYDSLLFPAD